MENGQCRREGGIVTARTARGLDDLSDNYRGIATDMLSVDLVALANKYAGEKLRGQCRTRWAIFSSNTYSGEIG